MKTPPRSPRSSHQQLSASAQPATQCASWREISSTFKEVFSLPGHCHCYDSKQRGIGLAEQNATIVGGVRQSSRGGQISLGHKGVHTIHQGEKCVFNIWSRNNWIYTCRGTEFNTHIPLWLNINSQWTRDLSVVNETLKILGRRKHRSKRSRYRRGFLKRTPNSTRNNPNHWKWWL